MISQMLWKPLNQVEVNRKGREEEREEDRGWKRGEERREKKEEKIICNLFAYNLFNLIHWKAHILTGVRCKGEGQITLMSLQRRKERGRSWIWSPI